MTKEMAREKIIEEFMSKYYEWLKDREELSNQEYGMKYGWGKSEKLMSLKDNLTAVTFFQKYIFSGRWLPQWEKQGYERHIIWELHRSGFLSHDYWTNSNARASGRTDFFYLSQKVAKEVYKEYKGRQ